MALMAPVQRRAGRSESSAVVVRAYIRQYPIPEFVAEVKAAFPDKGIANPDEARVSIALNGMEECCAW